MRQFRLLLGTLLAMARHRPWQPLLIILAIWVASAGLSAVQLINEGARQGDLATATPPLLQGSRVEAVDKTRPLNRQDYVTLRRAGFTQFIAVVTSSAPLICQDSQQARSNITLLGVDLAAASSLTSLPPAARAVTSDQNTPGGAPSLASPATLAALDCNSPLQRRRALPVKAPVAMNGLPADTLVISISDFYTGDITPATTPLSALIQLGELDAQQQQTLADILPAHLQYRQITAVENPGTLSESFRLNLWAMGILMSVVALFIVLNALMLMYRARLNDVIRLRQLGVSSRLLTTGLLAEMAVYCLLATPTGVLTGLAVTRQLTPVLQATFLNLFDSVFIAPSPLLVSLMGQALLISLLSLSVFALIPARQLSQAISHQAMRDRASLPWARHLSTPRLTLLIAVVIVVSLLLSNDTLSALIGVAVILLGGCAVIVLWLAPLTRLLKRLTPTSKPLLSYTIASTEALSGKSRLAVCAFFIALSANIGMNVMTDSFRQATYQWLSQRLVAPVYLYTESLPDTSALPEGASSYPVYRGRSTLDNQPVTLRSYATSEQARNSLVLTAASLHNKQAAWQAFVAGTGVFINQQLALRHNLTPGDTLALQPVIAGGQTFSEPTGVTSMLVLGIYPDYGNPDSQYLLPLPLFAPATGFAGVTAVYGITAAQADALFGEQQWYASDQLITLSMATFDRTFVVTDALNIATLLVAGLAFAIAVSVLTLDIRPQLSVLRAMGVGKWQLKAALTAQYMLLCVLTAAAALPFGLLLAWVFINQVNRFAFAWTYPLQISWPVLLGSVAFSLALVLCVLILPLGRLRAKVDLRQENTL
ncbi:FtsX-like permease family protein [Salinimonas lutimaris]|uniref:FtsX-like permease family protein n=1 Tax=Salinimonas lutimaris TaxID=914153 RepID=UPI0010BFEC8E|nr:FtsX-like permease family protein [Salinimonas lutimaris]